MWQQFICNPKGHTYLSTSSKRQVKKVKERGVQQSNARTADAGNVLPEQYLAVKAG